MKLDYSKKYIFDKEFEMIENQKKFLFIDYNNVNWFRTNNTGMEIISLCDGELSLDQVIDKIADKYQFDKESLKSSFEDYILEAIENSVLIEVGTDKQIIENDRNFDVINDLWIHISGMCNLSCPFCYSKSGGNEKRELDFDVLIRFLEGIEKEKRNNIVLSGGEPFLYKKLPELVKTLREMEFKRISLISNGTLGEEVYDKVLPYINALQLSVDGTSEAYHDLTRGNGSYQKMIRNLKLAKETGVERLVISFTPTKYNIDDLPNIPQFAFDNGIDAIHVTRLMPVGRGKTNMEDISPDPKKYEDSLRKFIENYHKVLSLIHIKKETERLTQEQNEKIKYLSLTFAGDQTYKVAYRTKKMGCGAGLGSMSINYDGSIYPCASLHKEEFKFGNINSDDVNSVIENAKDFMQKHTVENIPGCKDCKLKYFCGGGCRACAVGCTGNICDADPMCERYKTSMIEALWVLNLPEVNVDVFSENPV